MQPRQSADNLTCACQEAAIPRPCALQSFEVIRLLNLLFWGDHFDTIGLLNGLVGPIGRVGDLECRITFISWPPQVKGESTSCLRTTVGLVDTLNLPQVLKVPLRLRADGNVLRLPTL